MGKVMTEKLLFTIEIGNEVTVYENDLEFTDVLLDLLSHNETVTLKSQRKGDEVYVTLL